MSELLHHFESVGLNYCDEGEGPPVLFVHGVGSSLESWDGVIARLGPGRRYVRFDLRGHGASKRTPGPYSLDGFVDDCVALLDHLGLERVELIGFSLGGLIAQAMALSHPHRLTGMTLISTIAGRSPEERSRVMDRAETLAREGAVAHLANAVDRWFTDEFRQAHPEVMEARRLKSLQNDPDCYVAAYRVLAGNDLGEKLAAIRLPTLVMTGENDIGSSPRMARFIHERVPGSELHILPHLKHSVLLEAPDQVGDLIDSFLRSRQE